MVILGGLMPAVIDFIIVLNDAATLMLARGADFLSAFDKPQRAALAVLFLRLHDQEILAAEILWGLWLFPLGPLSTGQASCLASSASGSSLTALPTWQ
jgi:hypothetical protein